MATTLDRRTYGESSEPEWYKEVELFVNTYSKKVADRPLHFEVSSTFVEKWIKGFVKAKLSLTETRVREECVKSQSTPVQKEYGTGAYTKDPALTPQTSSGEKRLKYNNCEKCGEQYGLHSATDHNFVGVPWTETLPSPSSESWVEKFNYFARGRACILINRPEREVEFQEIISFIKNTIIPAEVERGRRQAIEELFEIEKTKWKDAVHCTCMGYALIQLAGGEDSKGGKEMEKRLQALTH